MKGELVYETFLTAREYAEQNLALLPTGAVFNRQTRQPLANVKITLAGPQGFDPRSHLLGGESNAATASDAQGRFNFSLTPDAPAGLYRWQVQADGEG